MCHVQTDVITIKQNLDYRLNLYKLREARDISPKTFASLLASMLYEKRCVCVSTVCVLMSLCVLVIVCVCCMSRCVRFF